jgi:hypothetical protein
MDHEMEGINLSGNLKTGVSLFGVFGNFNVGIFYNTEYVKNNTINTPAYGYMYLQEPFKGGTSSKNAKGEKYILDYNREKDGLVTKSSPNLALPLLTYDYYNVDGQGLSGMFRPFRSDIGHIHDPFMESKSYGGSLGFELPVKHFGASATYTNSSNSTSDLESSSFLYTFAENPSGKSNYEPAYFKMHGDMAAVKTDELGFIGGEDAVYMPVVKNGSIVKDGNSPQLKKKDESPVNDLTNYRGEGERMPRETSIQYLTNENIGSYSTNPFGEYNIKTLKYSRLKSSSFEEEELNRTSRSCNGNTKYISKHIGAITALNSEGARYVYALPAYNLEQREHIFSVTSGQACNVECQMPIKTVDGADRIDYESATPDKYYKKTETPPYAHSYLLTSILGADYVDLTNNGPSNDDLGYWVKFNYFKVEDYGWRAPYKDANFDPGLLSFKSDDKGSFMYGKKEMYYLASAETKTHIAIFSVLPRDDGKGTKEFNRTPQSNFANDGYGNSYTLNSIKIYSKYEYNANQNCNPIKTVNFSYDYELCPNVENNKNYAVGSTTAPGKLTLKKLWFTYYNNNTGILNPYEFSYSNNYAYRQDKYDRWGNYKSTSTGACDRVHAPYVDQTDYTARDNDASAWQLSSIRLPSGGNISINYESDDYAYVQHRQATQMFKIESLGITNTPSVVFNSGWNTADASGNTDQRKIYFNLNHPISKELLDPAKEFKEQYLDGLVRREGNQKYYQVYFKVKSKIRGTISEFISGYAEIDMTSGNYGVDSDNGTAYTRGFITLKSFQTDRNKQKYYHPFAAAAWQFIRTNKPELITAPGTFKDEPGTDNMDKAMKAKSLLSVANSIRDIFKDYNAMAFTNQWGNAIYLNESYIRLCSPDKKKYGGGSRVKSVTINDNWKSQTGNAEEDATYGQVYDYTIEEDGKTISSGVASYEPMIGGDENPLRYAKKYSNNVPFKSPNQLYFEYPINESLYPGPSVGYRKVTVRSLAAEAVVNDDTGKERSTGGVSINEFYTCKEFPVITEETDIDKKAYDLVIPIPLIGTIETHNLSAGQGYAIKLNDMHGKPKSVKNYAIDKKGNIAQLVSSVEYYYKRKEKVLDGILVYEPDNEVDVMLSFYPDAGSTTSKIERRLLGTEYDFVTDMRLSKSNSFMGGVNINVDFIVALVPIPIPVPWPAINKTNKVMRTAVTNKVVFKPGILEKVVQTDGSSVVTSENVLFDEATGKPLLTKVTNEFNNDVFNLSLPAYKEYDGMGQAYINQGMSFAATATSASAVNTYALTPNAANSDVLNYLFPGDDLKTGNYKVTVLYKNAENVVVYCDNNISGSTNFKIIRSGKRNMLTANSGGISILNSSPLGNIQTKNCTYTINVPYVEYQYILMKDAINIYRQTGITDLNDPVYNKCNSLRTTYNDIRYDLPPGPSQTGFGFSKIGGGNTNYTCITLLSSTGYIDAAQLDQITNIYLKSGNIICDAIENGVVKKNVSFQSSHYPIKIDAYAINYYDKSCSTDYLELSNVINSNFNSFSDNWIKNSVSENPYQSGQKGIWLPKNIFAYLGTRLQSASPNLKTDGIIVNIPVVNLQNPYFTLCKPEWKVTEEITRVSEHSKGIESKDILGRFSIVLFGYSGGEATLTAANSKSDEIGYQGFEDKITNSYISATNYYFSSDNLSFARSSQTKNANRQYEVLVGNGQAVVIDKPYNPSETYSQVTVQAFLEKTADRKAEQIVFKSYNINNLSANAIYSNKTALTINDADERIFINDRLWTGFVVIPENADANANSSQVINTTAHTGKYSLLSDGGVNLQRSFNLIPNKEYVLDFWMKSSVFSPSLIKRYDAAGNSISDITVGVTNKVGNLVNGWQKMQVTFSLPSNGKYIGLVFPASTYIDDIRIYPFQASVKTYVYNTDNLKLAAILDENNYASFYYYDEQGNLFLVKKETENGIQTIQESRSHMPEKQ